MFTNISWATYLTMVAVSLLLWYVLIGVKFYFSDIKDFLNGKRSFRLQGSWNTETEGASLSGQAGTNGHLAPKGEFEEQSFNDFGTIEELVEMVKALIITAVENKTPKKDFLTRLGAVLKVFPSLKKSQFRPSVNEFISSESELQGLASITEEEVERLWDEN